jgi:hypothetical protein
VNYKIFFLLQLHQGILSFNTFCKLVFANGSNWLLNILQLLHHRTEIELRHVLNNPPQPNIYFKWFKALVVTEKSVYKVKNLN